MDLLFKQLKKEKFGNMLVLDINGQKNPLLQRDLYGYNYTQLIG